MRAVAIVVCCWFVAGCATVAPPLPPGMDWTRTGLVNWARSESSLTAEIDFGGNAAGDLAMTVQKQQVLLLIVRSGDRWSASGPLARGGWSGTGESAPLALAGWITLAETLGTIRGASESLDAMVTGSTRARWTRTSAEIIPAETGEQFRVVWRD